MTRRAYIFLPLIALFTTTVGICDARAQQAEPFRQPVAEGEDVETLLRGPLHEAYAEPIQSDAAAGIVVPKKPPAPIDEIPPETQPADENVIWIPGYWAWDYEREDFLWVSGVWRVPPPDRQWVPGYWVGVEGGFQWVPGFWAADEAEQIRYLPQPPESLERGPTSDPPSDSHYWVSGCWRYREGLYAWQPGYWGIYQEGWVWIQPHYSWTPRGVIFVGGHWDYPLAYRGLVFAPVYFHRPVYTHSGYYYSPSVAINVANLLLHLFVQPGHHHYYWGDYYGDRYRRAGYYGWHDHHLRHDYDPLFVYYQTHYKRHDVDFAKRLHGWNEYYRKHDDRRPARTFEAQVRLAERARTDEHLKQSLLGRSTKEILADRDSSARYRRLQEQERRALSDSRKELRGLSEQRLAIESKRATESEQATIRDERTEPGEKKPDAARGAAEPWRLPERRRTAVPDSVRRPPARTPAARGESVDDARRDNSSERRGELPRRADDNERRVPNVDRDRYERTDRSQRTVRPQPTDRPEAADRSRERDDARRGNPRSRQDSSRDASREDSRRRLEPRDRSQNDEQPRADAPKRSKPERSEPPKSKPPKKEKKD